MTATPLSDCTNSTLQAMNKESGDAAGRLAKAPPTPPSRSEPRTTVKRFRHNPYGPCLSAQDSILSPMSSYPSPLQWTASAEMSPYNAGPTGYGYVSEASTPFLSYAQLPDDVNRPLFASGTGAQPEAGASLNTSTTDASHSAQQQQQQQRGGSKSATPMKSLGRIYVGGRPKPIRRRYTADVVVALRGGEATFRLADVYAVFPPEVAVDALAGHYVIVEGDRGIDMGQIVSVARSDLVEVSTATDHSVDDEAVADREAAAGSTLPRVLRLSDQQDMMCFDMLDRAEAEALLHCRACVTAARMPVPIQIERAIFQFDRQKLTLQYTSDAYVDFKALTRALHNHHKCRIWMHQLNRDAVRAATAQGSDKRRNNRKSGGGKTSKTANRGRN